MTNTEAVKAALAHKPRPAAAIAKEAGLPLDLAYHALVQLYDKSEAFIVTYYPDKGQPVSGWASA